MKKNYSYATSIFQISSETKKTELIFKQLDELKTIISNDQETLDLLSNIFIKKSQRKNIVNEFINYLKFDELIKHWLFVMIDNDNIKNLLGCIDDFKDIYFNVNNISLIEVTSIKLLTENEKQKIIDYFNKKNNEGNFKNKYFVENKVDKKIINGYKIIVNNKTYDFTFKGRIDNIKSKILELKE